MTSPDTGLARPIVVGRPQLEPAIRAGALLVLVAILGLIAWHIALKAREVSGIGVVYTVVVSSYVLTRFTLAAAYRTPKDAGIEPEVAIIVPAFNEGEAVARTIHACLSLDYPREKLQIVVVNDGSSDDTWEHMTNAAAMYPDGSVRCVDLGSNQGKRAAMTAGIRSTTAEIMVFVDSDSMPERDGVRKLVQIFARPKVGAGSGLTMVRNANVNALTKMQQARYYISFQLLKTAESVLGAVTCNPGCFSAYRREAVLPLLPKWEHQMWWGTECTFGDDRALTNMVLRSGWQSRYHDEAVAWTDVPERYHKFFRQQLRWKKSWLREGPKLLGHMWRTRPLAFPALAIQTIAGIMSPFVMTYNLIIHSAATGVPPTLYPIAMYLIACAYGLLYRGQRADGLWKWAIVGTFFYIAFSPQLVWAAIRVRDTSWGTRAAAVPPTLPASADAGTFPIEEQISCQTYALVSPASSDSIGPPSPAGSRPSFSAPSRSPLPWRASRSRRYTPRHRRSPSR
jgi:hyaluronan synthase